MSKALGTALDTYEAAGASGRGDLIMGSLRRLQGKDTALADPGKWLKIKSEADVKVFREFVAEIQRAEEAAGSIHDLSLRIQLVVDAREREMSAAKTRYADAVGATLVDVSGAWSDGPAAAHRDAFTAALSKVARVFGLANARFEVRGPDSTTQFYQRHWSASLRADLLACNATELTDPPLAPREHNPYVMPPSGADGWVYGLYWSIWAFGEKTPQTIEPTMVDVNLQNMKGQELRIFYFSGGYSVSIDGVEVQEKRGSMIPADLSERWNEFFAHLKPC